MTPASDQPTLPRRLRNETRPAHNVPEQSDFNQHLLAGTVTAADAARLLAKLCGLLRPCKAQLDRRTFAPEGKAAPLRSAHPETMQLAAQILTECPVAPADSQFRR